MSKVISVGRAADAVLRLDDPRISSRHALIYAQDGKLFVADSGSRNGVFVNGSRIDTAAVGPLDEIQLGSRRLKVELRGADPLAALEQTQRGGQEETVVGLSPSFAPRRTSSAAPPPAAGPRLDAQHGRAPETTLPPSRPPARLPEREPPPSRIPQQTPATTPSPRRPPPRAPAAPSNVEVQQAAGPAPAETQPARSSAARAAAADESPTRIVPSGALGQPELSILPPASEPAFDEEEHEEREFTPSFSVLEVIARDAGAPKDKTETDPVVEVIRYRDDRLLAVTRVPAGNTFALSQPSAKKPAPLLQVRSSGRARLFFAPEMEGSVVIGGQTAPISSLCIDQNIDKRRKTFAADLNRGDYAHLQHGGAGYLVRFVHPPRMPEAKLTFTIDRQDKIYTGMALGGIVVMLLAIWIQAMLAPRELLVQPEEVEFAEISLKELELEKPPEPEPLPELPPAPLVEEPPSQPKPEPVPKPTPKPKVQPKKVARAPKAAAPPGPARSAASKQAANALAALGNIAPASGGKSLSAAVSNLAAVRVPSGAPSTFQVAGAIGKLPSGEVSIASGGSGRDTRSAAQLLAGKGEVGKLGGAGGKGRVRAVVSRTPARQVGTTGGSLDRGEILKVVNAGIGDVQRCYERELLRNPGLSGKIVYDWVIAPSGSVQRTAVRSASLKSTQVQTCISGVIRGWKFPKPRGGAVKVTFPFIFNVQGF